jgi:hypothetical protein
MAPPGNLVNLTANRYGQEAEGPSPGADPDWVGGPFQPSYISPASFGRSHEPTTWPLRLGGPS